jgi:hypothetical protein
MHTSIIKNNVQMFLANLALLYEEVWGSECMDPRFLYLGTSWRWVVSFNHLPPYTREKEHLYLLVRMLGGPQNRSQRYGEVKILDPTGTRTPTRRSSSPCLVAIPTALPRLLKTIPTERPPLVGEVSANVCGQTVSRGQRNGSPRPYSRFSRPRLLH